MKAENQKFSAFIFIWGRDIFIEYYSTYITNPLRYSPSGW